VDHGFVRLQYSVLRGNKADLTALDMIDAAFRQNFDKISPGA